MTIAWTDEYLDITDGTFTENGSPTKDLGQHSLSNTTYDFDKTNDYLSSSESVIDSGATKFTFGFWVFWDGASGAKYVLTTRATAAAGQFFYVNIHGSTGRLYAIVQNAGGDQLRSATSASVPSGIWTHYVITANTTTTNIDIHENGVDTAYFLDNDKLGTTDATMTADTLGVSSLYSDSYSAGIDGKVDRIKVASGVEGTEAEALEEYNAECAAVVVPTFTDSDNDLTVATYTANGGATITDDQHNPSSTYLLDGSAGYLSTTIKPFDTGSGITHAMRTWARADDTSQNGAIIAQHASSTDRGFMIFQLAAGTLFVEFCDGGGNNNIRSTIAAGMLNWDDGNYHLITATCYNGTDVRVWIDGVEATSYVSKDVIVGTGFATGFGAGIDNLHIGAITGGTNLFPGIPSRPGWWEGKHVSACQIAKDFSNEFAAIGEGFDTSTKSPIITDIYSTDLITDGVLDTDLYKS